MSLALIRKTLRKQGGHLDLSKINSVRAIVRNKAAMNIANIESELKLFEGLDVSIEQHILYEDLCLQYEKEKSICSLVDELCLSHMYVEAETLIKRYALEKIPNILTGKKSTMEMLLLNLPFDIETLPGHTEYTELRLLNNCIKHDSSEVSARLSKIIPSYKNGEKLTNLHEIYERLEPKIQSFVTGFYNKLYEY